MPAPPCPPGECPQCWHHANVLHKGNWLGLVREPPCAGCDDHRINGCPTRVPKKPTSWW